MGFLTRVLGIRLESTPEPPADPGVHVADGAF